MIATVGTDPMSGVSRFTFGRPDLLDGIEPILVMVGLFAVSELMIAAGARRLGDADGAGRCACSLPSLPMMRRLSRRR